MSFRLVTLALLLLLPSVTSLAVARIPATMPETLSVDGDLKRLHSECGNARTRLYQIRQQVRSARQDVERSIEVCNVIRATDKRLVKLIDQLKPYTSVPKVRTIARTLIKNLQRIQSKVHSLRKKTDDSEKQILAPMKKRLRELEQTIYGGETKLSGYASTVTAWRESLRSTAMTANSIPGGNAAMERSARLARPKTRAISNSVAVARSQADKVAALLVRLTPPLDAFEHVGHSLKSFGEKVAPAEKTAGKLDQTLGKRLTIKIPFSKKSVRFSIRQILEKPGDVIGVVLKPLEKLADKLLQPVLKKLKLEIKAPRGLTELSDQVTFLSSIGAEVAHADIKLTDQLSSQLDQVFRSWQTIRPRYPRQSAPPAGRPSEIKPRPIQVAPVAAPVAAPAKRTKPVMFLQF